MELDNLITVLRSFADRKVEYVLIGAAALNVHGIVRATEDADIFLRPSCPGRQSTGAGWRWCGTGGDCSRPGG